jgi:RNA polymerase sigma-70 factor, ECF subfamily
VSYLREVRLHDNFGPFVACRENFGFIPRLARAQTLLPRLVEAQVALESCLLVREGALSRAHKQLILLSVSAAQRNAYCVTRHWTILRSLGTDEPRLAGLLKDFHHAGLSVSEEASLAFALKLTRDPATMNSEDIEGLRRSGFDDGSILETVLVTALGCFLCTLSTGLGPEPDFEPPKLPSMKINSLHEGYPQRSVLHEPHMSGGKGSYLPAPYQSPKTFAPFGVFQKRLGFIPNFFRAQTLLPDVLEAEVAAVTTILFPEDVLTRVQKECIFLATSAANLNSYCVAVHCNILRGLGLSPEDGDQVAVDHHESDLSEADKALLDFAVKLGSRPSEFGLKDVELLRTAPFTDEQILECVAVTALTNFANTLNMGLGVVPDFELPPAFASKKLHPFAIDARPMTEGVVPSPRAGAIADPDAALVTEARGGCLEAFEALIRRHTSCVYRTLMAILGDPDAAKDAMQDAFLSAFKHISNFEGRSKFSTWLVSIARNAGLQRLRNRKRVVSLDEDTAEGAEDFRPRQVRAWQDDPERMYSSAQMRQLVERGILQLPPNYRVVVILRDIEQLSTEEVARQLGLSVPALKTRLLRGRLMLREFLSPYFAAGTKRAGS